MSMENSPLLLPFVAVKKRKKSVGRRLEAVP